MVDIHIVKRLHKDIEMMLDEEELDFESFEIVINNYF